VVGLDLELPVISRVFVILELDGRGEAARVAVLQRHLALAAHVAFAVVACAPRLRREGLREGVLIGRRDDVGVEAMRRGAVAAEALRVRGALDEPTA